MIQFLFFLHFILIFLIISCVLLQRSSESSVLVSSNHFSVGTANKLLVKITRSLVAVFMVNCLFISHTKYGQTFNKDVKNANTPPLKQEKSTSVPVE